jgi:hypothetical protein
MGTRNLTSPAISSVAASSNLRDAAVPFEMHFLVPQLARRWGVSEGTAREWFQNEPGVLRFKAPSRRGKRGYISLRVPESVARKVYNERLRVLR